MIAWLQASRPPAPARAAHAHRLPALRPRAVPRRGRGARRRSATSRSSTSAAGLGGAYLEDEPAPSAETWIDEVAGAVHDLVGPETHLIAEPGRALVANGCVTLYSVETVKRNASTVGRGRRRDVRQPAPDALRRPLRGPPGRRVRPTPGDVKCRIAGKHCESGDVIVWETPPRRPAPRRPARHPGHRRLRPRDGQQLQRRAAPARRVLRRRRRARRRAPRDLRRPPGPGCLSFRVGLLGHGTVGAAFDALLAERGEAIERITGIRPELSGVLTRSRGDFEEILAGSRPRRRGDGRHRARRATTSCGRCAPASTS